jgi:SAM-dependent methyltransferase
MTNYTRMYRLGMTPWEKYGPAAAASIAAALDREEGDRGRPLGRALDLGCGRGQFTPELARRGWQAVGIDYVPAAIEAANSRGTEGVTYLVADVTNLAEANLGCFDFFLDIGCFQGFDADQRQAAGEAVSALANPGATIAMLAFGPSRYRRVVGGVSRHEVEAAFPGWELLAAEPADTAGLGWPMNRTAPRWYRLRYRSSSNHAAGSAASRAAAAPRRSSPPEWLLTGSSSSVRPRSLRPSVTGPPGRCPEPRS